MEEIDNKNQIIFTFRQVKRQILLSELVDVIGNGNCYSATPDCRRETVECRMRESIARWESGLLSCWTSFFIALRFLTSVFLVFLVQLAYFLFLDVFYRFLVPVIVVFGDFVVKPLLTAVFNGLVRPALSLVWNALHRASQAVSPLVCLLRSICQAIAVALASFRLVHVHYGDSGSWHSTRPVTGQSLAAVRTV
jgi:hypothetical protein